MSGSSWYYGTYGNFQIQKNVDYIEQLVKDNKLADQVQAERENGKNWDDLKKDLGDIKKSLQDMGKNQIQVYNVSM